MIWWKNLVAIVKYFSGCLDAITKGMDLVSTAWPVWPTFHSAPEKAKGASRHAQPEVSAPK